MGEYLTPDQMDRRDAAYDLANVQAARPAGAGECANCLRWVRARFPVLIGCMNRVSVDMSCAKCAMQPGSTDESRWCIWRPTRREAERFLSSRLAAHQHEGDQRG